MLAVMENLERRFFFVETFFYIYTKSYDDYGDGYEKSSGITSEFLYLDFETV